MTIAALMNQVDAIDCREAEARLQRITAIRPIDSDPRTLGKHELAIDLKMLIDLEPLVAAVPNLRSLELPNAIPGSLTSLRHLKQLTSLTLSEANIDDMTPVSDLTNLVSLNLRGNIIRDLSPVIKLQNLEHLDISDNQIRDFTSLSSLPKLFSVRLQGNPIDTSTCLGKWADACERDPGRAILRQ